jgi:hypothetical protein
MTVTARAFDFGHAAVQGAAAGAKCGTATGIVGLCMRK